MAVTKLLRIKEKAGSNKSSHLQKNIFYICQDAKTGGGLWIGGNAGNTPGMIYRTMMENKKLWGKEDGSQGFHYVLSFSPDSSVDEELAFKIAEEFCGELLGDDFYYAIAVHNDRAHMHVHITFDSVSKTDGMKFHSPKGDWEKRIQPITDRLCEKYHLPTLEYEEERKGKNYGAWKHSKQSDKEGKDYYTWADIIRDDVDEAIHFSDSYDGFLSYLQEDGYKVTRNGAVLSLLPVGAGRAFRTGRLGDGYAKDEIIQRIADKVYEPEIEYRYKTYGNRTELREVIYAKIIRTPGWKMTPFQRQFWRRWNNTYFIRKPQRKSPEERQKNKQDILEVQKLSSAISYMLDHDIQSVSDLDKRKKELFSERDAIEHRLSVCSTKYYKKQPFYFVGQCEKLKAEYQKNPSPELEQNIKGLVRKIEKVCPYAEASQNRNAVKKEMDECRCVLKDNRKEIKVVDDTFRLYYQMEPREIIKNKVIPDGRIETVDEDIAERKGKNKDNERRTESRTKSRERAADSRENSRRTERHE